MTAVALLIRPTDTGWGVYLSNGQELTRYRGPWAKTLALRYLQRYAQSAASPRRPVDRWWHRRTYLP
jgi:hypothetical protein